MAMRLQPYMIYVLYNHDAPLFTDKTLPIMEVQLGEKVNYDYERNYWYTFNYFRGYVIDADGKVCFLQAKSAEYCSEKYIGLQLYFFYINYHSISQKKEHFSAGNFHL